MDNYVSGVPGLNVLVTGGAGFIGSHTVEALLGLEWVDRVIVVDNMYMGSYTNLYPAGDKLVFINRDIRDLEALISEFKRRGLSIDGIIHLAAIVGVDEVVRDPYTGLSVNVGGTINMLELARRMDSSRIVYASSAAVYGDPGKVPVAEDYPANPINLYGESKYIGERLVDRYRLDYGLSTISLRYFNVYGPRMRPGPYSGVIYKFMTTLLRGEAPVIYGDGGQTRDFIYVSDVADANIKALESKATGAYNIGTGRETSINELYVKICGIIGYCPQPRNAPPRRGDVYRSAASIEKAVRILGWKPRVSLEEGLRLTINYYRKLLA